ncbi:MAG: methanol dehydrogenase [Bacteroidota bacterium]|nr:methanol dehydrogenase [Bacteroidota bacterium]
MTSHLNKLLFSLFLLLQFFATAQSVDKEGIPEAPNSPRLVNDFAGMLSNDNKQELENKLVAFNDSTSTQITIVTVETIGDYSIDDFAVRLGRKWGIGQKGKNNGILITVAKQERKVDIETGYGVESYVTDYDSKHIIDELITPAFKQSNYYKGLDDATNRLIGLMLGTYKADRSAKSKDIPPWAIFLIIGFIFFVISLSRKKGRSGFTGGSGGWIFTGGLGGLGGGSWGGGGGSSGGFGGFGGGSFGGGGSSGSW